VVNVVKEPDIGLIEILIEWDSVAICDIKNALVSIFSKKNSNNTLFGVLSYSIVVINN